MTECAQAELPNRNLLRSDLDAFRAEFRSDLHRALAIQAAAIIAANAAALAVALMLVRRLAE